MVKFIPFPDTSDAAEPHRFAEDSWRPVFALLRDQAPVLPLSLIRSTDLTVRYKPIML